MKNCVLCLVACLFAIPHLSARQEGDVIEEVGFVQIVNGVSTDKPTYIKFGDVEGGESEIPAGATSGMMGLSPGDYTFEVRNSRCQPNKLSGSITIEAGKTFALVFFNDFKKAEEEGGKDEYHLRHTALTRQHEHKEPKLSLVSLSKIVDLSVKVGSKFVTLRQYRAVDVDVKPGDILKVRYGQEVVGSIEAIAPVHYVGFIFDHDVAASGLGFSQIQHQQIVYDPPTDLDDEEEEGEEKISSEKKTRP